MVEVINIIISLAFGWFMAEWLRKPLTNLFEKLNERIPIIISFIISVILSVIIIILICFTFAFCLNYIEVLLGVA